MSWSDVDKSSVRLLLDELGLDAWMIRSWMVDRHEVCSTIMVLVDSPTPHACGIDVLDVGDSGGGKPRIDAWHVDGAGVMHRSMIEEVPVAPAAEDVARLLLTAVRLLDRPSISEAHDWSVVVPADVDPARLDELVGRRLTPLRRIERSTGARILVNDDISPPTITIQASTSEALAEATEAVDQVLHPPTPEVGRTYMGRVVNITKFGAFINILPGRDGLLHVSRLAPLAAGQRVSSVEQVLSLGDALEVTVEEIDAKGKVSLSVAGSAADEEPAPDPLRSAIEDWSSSPSRREV